MLLRMLLIMAPLLLCAVAAWAQTTTLVNPTKREYTDEVVRLKTAAPGEAGTFTVKENGVEIPYQVETIDGTPAIWVCSHFAPLATHTYQIAPGTPQATAPKVTVKRDGDVFILDNGLVAVKVPAVQGDGIPGPVRAVRLPGDKWVGGSTWQTRLKLKAFSATVIDDGTVLGKVRLRYTFDAMAGLSKDIPAFAEVDVTLGPGWKHVALFERHEMSQHDAWEFVASQGWQPTFGESEPFSAGPGSGEVTDVPPHNRPLLPGAVPLAPEELFLNMFPRWNQHYKDGWSFVATDGQQKVGAMVVRASQWIWPHDNSIQAVVKPTGDYAGLRAPTWKGQRLWWLVAGAAADVPAGDIDYVARYAQEGLDKINHDFITEWPGVTAGGFWSMNFFGGEVNPTHGIRGQGKAAIANAGQPGDLTTLFRVQMMLHGDGYGDYWNFWSPENPNFFTDYSKIPIALISNLRNHPQFETFRKMAEMRFREDLYHSITMPGGAGQECPGYMRYALEDNLVPLAKVCKEYLGFDPMSWDRVKAGLRFYDRISYPDGDVRRASPLGDSHPDRAGGTGMARVKVADDEVKSWKTEELPGFGVIFTNNPGTDKETYLSFKAGPNRGHFHGDQLSFHCCANAHPVAVDHHCSYHPRAGQEHMHNRVAFGTDEMPWANMDGYERLIAFKTSADVDIAVGQVESERLRHMRQFPPERWHEEYPQVAFDKPLVYRRTMVMVKNGAQDYFVIRDQYQADRALNATFCLHTYGSEPKQQGPTIDFGKLTLYCATPAQFTFAPFAWSHDNGGHEETQGARLTIKADHGEFITVMYPGKAPAITTIPGGVKVGDDEITFGGGLDEQAGTTYVTVKRGGKAALALTGQEIDLNRSQGEVGLFVPDAGYPFGTIPDWLAKQRAPRPDWAK